MSYNYKIGTFDERTGFLSHFGTKLVVLGIGATVGFYMGAMVVVGEIQASVQPLTVTQATPSLSVQPLGVTSYSQFTEPADYQPALGVNAVQPVNGTNFYQPTKVVGQYQPAARVGVYQRTVTGYQIQGEQLKLN